MGPGRRVRRPAKRRWMVQSPLPPKGKRWRHGELSMRQVKEVLRQKWVLGRSHREIARSVGISAGSVGDTLVRAKHVGLADWAVIAELSEEALEQRLYGPREPASAARPLPDAAMLD